MSSPILAHGGGIDELMMLFGFPTAVGLGVWLLTRRKPSDDTGRTDTEPSDANADPSPP